MEDLLPIGIMIIIFTVLAGLFNKIKQAIDEAQRRTEEQNRRVELPEATRRQIYGDGERTIRRARPLMPEAPPEYDGEGVNDEDVEVAPPPPRPQYAQPRPVQPPVARPASPWQDLRRQLEDRAREAQQQVQRQLQEAQAQKERERQEELRRRQLAQSAQRQATDTHQTEYERQQQLRRQQREPQGTGPQAAPPREPARQAPAPVRRAPRPRPTRHHPLLGGAADIRRAIILREVLGPPKGFE